MASETPEIPENTVSAEEQYRQERIASVTQADYPHSFQRSCTFDLYIGQYTDIEQGSRHEDKIESLAGRVVEKRSSGNKLRFYTITSDGNTLQLLVDRRIWQGEDGSDQDFDTVNNSIHRGDIIGATGIVGKSKRGELSLMPHSMVRLAPCLRMIPKREHGLTDVEDRHRNRCLDMIVHDNPIHTLKKRAAIIRTLRMFFNHNRFTEVETPTMAVQAGGATAKPFVTHHNELKRDLYLRVAPELYLKRLIVGGMDRVFEIGKNYRNEGIDRTHNPEFTALEFYAAYMDYYGLMDLTESMFSFVIPQVNNGSMTVEYEGKTINFTPPYRRVSVITELERILETTFPIEYSSEDSVQFLLDMCESRNIVCPLPHTPARLIDRLIGELIEPSCVNPTFLTDHPLEMSPLAKWHRDDPTRTERFELFVNGTELINAYTELNDPQVQLQRFMEQAAFKKQGDTEAHDVDMDFVRALEYALPPTGGFGLGIDRLVMFLTGHTDIKEVNTFSILRDLN